MGHLDRGADQWLFVVEGTGTAIVEARRIYYPPAFTQGGNPKGPGQRKA